MPRPLTAAELTHHPAFKTLIWDLPPAHKGRATVAKDRGGPIELAYEIHGHGPIHLLWIMGLAGFKTAWQRQTKAFGHEAQKYSSMIFDNRGMGESDKPISRYSTSEMAQDAIDLLDSVSWTAVRSVHIIGVSMGGMIAQEIAMLVPERVASLSLVSTAARLQNTVGFMENLRDRINLFVPKSLDTQVRDIKHRLFSQVFLDLPDEDGEWPSNGDRIAAQEIAKRSNKDQFTLRGFLCQIVAAGWHHKSAAQLRQMGDTVGRTRIQVLHGTYDRMITPPHADTLIQELGGTESGIGAHLFEGRGHVLAIEEREEHNRLIAELVDKTHSMGA